jgi:hypothetical protein
MASPSVIAERRADAYRRILAELGLDHLPMLSTKAPPLEQQMFETQLLEALLARVVALESKLEEHLSDKE